MAWRNRQRGVDGRWLSANSNPSSGFSSPIHLSREASPPTTASSPLTPAESPTPSPSASSPALSQPSLSSSFLPDPFNGCLTPPSSPPQQEPDHPVTKPTTPTNTTMSITADLPEFKGDMNVDKIQPGNFLLQFKRATILFADDVKAKLFEVCLGETDSPARIWYNKLSAPDKSSWTTLETLFKAKFPDTPVASKSIMDWENELAAATIAEDKLGQTETVRGVEMHMHHKFAEQLLFCATKAGLASGSTLIGIVRQKLPAPIKTRIGVEFKDWTEFTKAIKDVPAQALKDHLEAQEERDKDIQQLKSQMAQLSRERLATTRTPPEGSSASGIVRTEFAILSPAPVSLC